MKARRIRKDRSSGEQRITLLLAPFPLKLWNIL